MNGSTFVTIVLPTFNRQNYLPLAIESCLAQSHANFELLIVNDASTDDTEAIALAFARRDPRVRVLTNPENSGISRSLNRGFAAARGTYFTWTSDDNLFEPQALEILVRALDDDPTTGLVFSDIKCMDESGRQIEMTRVQKGQRVQLSETFGACFMYRRTVSEAIGGYDARVDYVSDYKFWVLAARRFKVTKILDASPYLYRRHDGTITSRKVAEMFQQSWSVRRDLDVRYPRLRYEFLRVFSGVAYRLLRQRQTRALARHLLFGLSLIPFLTSRKADEIIPLACIQAHSARMEEKAAK